MKSISDLVFTSVQDAKSSLECTLSQSPQQALEQAEAVLVAMGKFQYYQPSRHKMLKTIINRANKALKAQKGSNN
ncbi:hypothetical protein HNP12_003398 [Aeromonas hydrophila]|uniref:hypothetical protein n=1 Tax=Aeromonas hydrophila TaxID=644 RepID=UPI00216AB170|nr:hypothetical protein [Aeromonas hydrophila]MCS3769285.1 hypothetical protein [Aeromonas hydrophila]MCS3791518.1 hypothetical protein [Aeromonas hydrophila]